MKPSPLAPDDEAGKKLQRTLKGLSLRPQEGSGLAGERVGQEVRLSGQPSASWKRSRWRATEKTAP